MKKEWKNFIKIMGVCFLLLFSLSYGEGEIPNTVVKDNPKAEITTVKTKERRTAPAELNIEVKKVKSTDLAGNINLEKKEISFDLSETGINAEASKIITKDKLIHVTKELETYPSVATTNGRKKWSNILEKYKTAKRTGKAVENDGLTAELVEVSEEGKELKKELKVGYTEENPPSDIYIGILNKNNYELEKIYKYGKRTFNIKGTVNDMLVLKNNFEEAGVIRLNSNYSFVSCGEYAHFNRRGIDNVLDVDKTGWFSARRLNKDTSKYNGIIPFDKEVTAKFTTADGKESESIKLYLAPKEIYAGSTERSPEYLNIGGKKWSTDEILGLPYDETKRFPKLKSLGLSSWPTTNYAGTPSKTGWGMIFEYGLIIDNNTLDRLIASEKRMIEVTTDATIPLYVFTNTSWAFSTTFMDFFKAGEIRTNLVLERNVTMSAAGDDFLEAGSISSDELKYSMNLDLNNLTDVKAERGTIEKIEKTADNYTAEYISESGASRFNIVISRDNNIEFKILKWNGEEINTSLYLEYIENGIKLYKDTIDIKISPTKEYGESMHLKANGNVFVTKYTDKDAVYTIYGLDDIKLGNALKEGEKTEVLEVLNKNIAYENYFNLKSITIKSKNGITKNVVKDEDRNAVKYISPSGNSEFILEFVKDFKLGRTKLKLTVNKWDEEKIDEVFSITGATSQEIILNISPSAEIIPQEGEGTIKFYNEYTEGETAYYSNNSMNNENVTISNIKDFMGSSVTENFYEMEVLDENSNLVLDIKKGSGLKSFQIPGIKGTIGINENDKFALSLDEWGKDIQGNIKVDFKNRRGKLLGSYSIKIIPPSKNYTVQRSTTILAPEISEDDINCYFYSPDPRYGSGDYGSSVQEDTLQMSFDLKYTEKVEIDSIVDLDQGVGNLQIANDNPEQKATWEDIDDSSKFNLSWSIGNKGNAPAVILQLHSMLRDQSKPSESFVRRFRIIAKDEGVRYVDNVYFGYMKQDHSDLTEAGTTKINILPTYNGELLSLLGNEIVPKKAVIDKTNEFIPSQAITSTGTSYLIKQGGAELSRASTMDEKIETIVKDEAGRDVKLKVKYLNGALQFSLNDFKESTEKVEFDIEIFDEQEQILKQTLDITFQKEEMGSVDIKFNDTYNHEDGLQKIGGIESSNEKVTISNINGIYPMSPEICEGTEKIEVLNNDISLGEMYIGDIRSYKLTNGTKIKLQIENENINLGLESWQGNVTEEMTVLLKSLTGVVLGKYTFNITTPARSLIIRNRTVRLQNINELKLNRRYYLLEAGIKANSGDGWGNKGDMKVDITDCDMTGDYIFYSKGTDFPTFKFKTENCTISYRNSSKDGITIVLLSDKMDGEFKVDITEDKDGKIYPQLLFMGKVTEAFEGTITMLYNDATNSYEDTLTLIIPETTTREEGNAELNFNNAYSASDGFLQITQSGVDPAYAELNVSSGTFPPTISNLSDNFEILSGGNKVAESSNMGITEAVLKNMTLRTGYNTDGKLNLMICDWISGKEDTIELVLKNGTTEKGRYTLGIKAPREGIEIISGSDILNFGTLVRGNGKIPRNSTWMTVDMVDEVEISAIKVDMSDPYIYLDGIKSTEEEKRIKILKIEARGSKNKHEKNCYDLTVEGELEAVKEDQRTGSYEGSVTLEMYIK